MLIRQHKEENFVYEVKLSDAYSWFNKFYVQSA